VTFGFEVHSSTNPRSFRIFGIFFLFEKAFGGMWSSEGIIGLLLLMHVNTCFLKRSFGGIQLRPNRGWVYVYMGSNIKLIKLFSLLLVVT
jgi:hypothetical protein